MTDNGRHFTSNEFREFLSALHIKHLLTTVHTAVQPGRKSQPPRTDDNCPECLKKPENLGQTPTETGVCTDIGRYSLIQGAFQNKRD